MGEDSLAIGLLFGGPSEEHDVSLMSVRSIWDALNRDRHRVHAIGVARDGAWFLAEDAEKWMEEGIPPVERADEDLRVRFNPGPGGGMTVGPDLRPLTLDVVFPVLHGPFGEDGRVQGLLDLLDIPYVGSGVAASGVSMDKEIMKALFAAEDLPVEDFYVCTAAEITRSPGEVAEEVEDEIGFPCFVKPASLGSSVGVSRVDGADKLQDGLQAAARYDSKIIVERAVDCVRELECSVLGNRSVRVAGPGEIIPAGSFYDYHSKYCDDDTRLLVPAPVPADVALRMREMAEQAFRSVFARGMARVDFFYRESEDEIILNEINTIPGFTSRSMYPVLLLEEGATFGDLVRELIELALEHHAEQKLEKGNSTRTAR